MAQDLFAFNGKQLIEKHAPLAERLRPRTLNEFVGQGAILAEGRLLRRAISADRLGNLLLHGPPGVGKTTLARIIASHTRSKFTVVNAVLAGIKEIRQEVEGAQKRLELHGLRTILFIDEVHRFNTAQQDALLPWVENGTLTLIGATTENPYFEVNKALVSRSRVFRLQPLEVKDLHKLLRRALLDSERGYGSRKVILTDAAANHLVDIASGDARSLLNAIELAVETTEPNAKGVIHIDLAIAEESIQQRAVLYDKHGDAHFDTISAFIKSLRGSDPDASLFWLARMVEAGENPRFIFRRMLIAAAEDIGLADPQAIVVVEACAAAFERVGLPEGLYLLAQASLYLATTSKSNSVMGFFEAQSAVRKAQRQDVPSHLRDAHRDGKAFGDGAGYKYPHAFAEHWVSQQYLPKSLQGEIFWKPSQEGWEGKRRVKLLNRRASQLATCVESEYENPFLLTSGPAISDFDNWVHRQMTQESKRLQILLDKTWHEVPWRRNDRVLALGGHSLLWALTPLRATPEGGVTILTRTLDDHARLASQVELLDSLLRPSLILASDDSFNSFSNELQFEWVGGRLHASEMIERNTYLMFESITKRCTINSGLRLLITSPLIGPAKALEQALLINSIKINNFNLLSKLISAEENWLDSLQKSLSLEEDLNSLGWEYDLETWEESLSISVDQRLINRWFSEGSLYRSILEKEEIIDQLDDFIHLVKLLEGKEIPQKLTHKLFVGRLKLN